MIKRTTREPQQITSIEVIVDGIEINNPHNYTITDKHELKEKLEQVIRELNEKYFGAERKQYLENMYVQVRHEIELYRAPHSVPEELLVSSGSIDKNVSYSYTDSSDLTEGDNDTEIADLYQFWFPSDYIERRDAAFKKAGEKLVTEKRAKKAEQEQENKNDSVDVEVRSSGADGNNLKEEESSWFSQALGWVADANVTAGMGDVGKTDNNTKNSTINVDAKSDCTEVKDHTGNKKKETFKETKGIKFESMGNLIFLKKEGIPKSVNGVIKYPNVTYTTDNGSSIAFNDSKEENINHEKKHFKSNFVGFDEVDRWFMEKAWKDINVGDSKGKKIIIGHNTSDFVDNSLSKNKKSEDIISVQIIGETQYKGISVNVAEGGIVNLVGKTKVYFWIPEKNEYFGAEYSFAIENKVGFDISLFGIYQSDFKGYKEFTKQESRNSIISNYASSSIAAGGGAAKYIFGLGGTFSDFGGWKIASLDTSISISLPLSGGAIIAELKFAKKIDGEESKKVWEWNKHHKFGQYRGPSNDIEQVIYDVYKFLFEDKEMNTNE